MQQIILQTPFSANDIERIRQCRGEHNRLGFAYQLAFVRAFNRFPAQAPLEVEEEIVGYASVHANIAIERFAAYGNRRKTVSEHQETLRDYLGLRPFTAATDEVEACLFKEACQLEQTTALKTRLSEFLRTHHLLEPSRDTVYRLIQTQREAARNSIYSRLAEGLSEDERCRLDALLEIDEATYAPLHSLKQPPGHPSPASFLKLTQTLDRIKETGVLDIEMRWINNNFQRSLARYARQCSLYRLRRLKEERRYAVLACFLAQHYQDTFDAAVQMHDTLMNRMYNKADKEIDEFMKSRRRHIRSSLTHYRTILGVLLDAAIGKDDIQEAIFAAVDVRILKAEMETIAEMLGNHYSDSFKRVITRHSSLRQCAPALSKHLTFQADPQDDASGDIIDAVALLDRMHDEGRYVLPEDAPTGCMPTKLHPFVFQDGKPHKPAWDCALLTALRDQVKSGNLYVPHSKRFASLDTFFIPEAAWASRREAFFARAGLPVNPAEVPAYLRARLNRAYDRFLERLPDNHYAQLDEEGWRLSSDPAEKRDDGTDKTLNPRKEWLGGHLRTIKLPELLSEVDNDLRFSRCFMPAADQERPDAQHVCEVLATVMAHARETGPYTMSQITEGMSYHRMKHITDWHMHEETQRAALALVVNAISGLDITQYWGDGT